MIPDVSLNILLFAYTGESICEFNTARRTAGKKRLMKNGWWWTADEKRLVKNGWWRTVGEERLVKNDWWKTTSEERQVKNGRWRTVDVTDETNCDVRFWTRTFDTLFLRKSFYFPIANIVAKYFFQWRRCFFAPLKKMTKYITSIISTMEAAKRFVRSNNSNGYRCIQVYEKSKIYFDLDCAVKIGQNRVFL